jgi:serine protein kinase
LFRIPNEKGFTFGCFFVIHIIRIFKIKKGEKMNLKSADEVIREFIGESKKHIRKIQAEKGLLSLLSGLKNILRPARHPNVIDFLSEAYKNKRLTETPWQRLERKIKEGGVKHLPEELYYFYQNPADILVYDVFDGLEGIEDALHELVKFITAAALNLEGSRQVLVLYSPPGAGKTTITSRLKKLMEKEEVYVLKGCPVRDSPLWLIPRKLRPFIEEKFGIKIDNFKETPRDICPSCRERLKNDYNYDFLKFPVEKQTFSQRAGVGIATSYPKDQFQDSITEFIGEIQLGKESTDPQAIISGLFGAANSGILHFEEGLRRSPEIFHVLISATQEGEVQAPGRLGKVSVSLANILTANTNIWEEFKSNSTNDLYVSRFYDLQIPFNVRLADEIKIIKKMIGYADSTKQIHISPFVFELIARMLIASRLKEIGTGKNFEEIDKIINIYNGAASIESSVDLRRKTRDGFLPYGLSIRELKKITDIMIAQLAEKEGHKCLSPQMFFNHLIDYFETNSRFDAEYLKNIENYVKYFYNNTLLLAMKKNIGNIAAVKEYCEKIFKNIQLGDYGDDLIAAKIVKKKELGDYLAALKNQQLTDQEALLEFIVKKALQILLAKKTEIDFSENGVWCPVCFGEIATLVILSDNH